jgi:GxxExxY protein
MPNRTLLEEAVTRSIIGAFYETYNTLGFGFVEHVYASALEYELRARGHTVVRELSVNVVYKGQVIAQQRLDMVVDDLAIVELKSTAQLPPFAPRQLFNYLQATSFQVGLVLHFGPKPAFHRQVHTRKGPYLPHSRSSAESATQEHEARLRRPDDGRENLV